jgi:hypothetical protein
MTIGLCVGSAAVVFTLLGLRIVFDGQAANRGSQAPEREVQAPR